MPQEVLNCERKEVAALDTGRSREPEASRALLEILTAVRGAILVRPCFQKHSEVYEAYCFLSSREGGKH